MKHLGVSDKTARNAFNQLIDLGFIELMEYARYQNGMAREFRLTYQPFSGREPTDEWCKIYEQNQFLEKIKNSS